MPKAPEREADRTPAKERSPNQRAPEEPDQAARTQRPSGGQAGAGPGGQLSPGQLALVLKSANKALGSRYRYGGNTRRGFDCSGLTTFVFDAVGIQLPRTADQQSQIGQWVPLDEARPGDLIFFSEDSSSDNQALTHVGLVVSTGSEPLTMIHASTSRGVVRTTVPSSRYWRERLRFARRLGK